MMFKPIFILMSSVSLSISSLSSEVQSENKRPLIGVCVLVEKEGKVLLGKRKSSHGDGSWATPGGHLEFVETVESCAARELYEETGLVILSSALGPWAENIMEEGTKHYITLFVFVNEFSGVLENLEPHKCEGWEWFDWDQLPEPIFPSVKSLIEKISLEKLKQTFLEQELTPKLD